MSKKALLALCIAVLIPVVCYWIVSKLSEDAVLMPSRYFPDTVINKIVDGKSVSDTLWHSVQNISLTNQVGDQVSLDGLKGKIIVVNFFFTRCPSICPAIMRNMKTLQDATRQKGYKIKTETDFVHLISLSVDPVRDSAEVLKKYADKLGVNPDVWWLLTGSKSTIYDFAFNELKIGIQDGKGIDSNFLHTDKFVLLDKERVVRGYYEGLDTSSVSKLAEDLTILMLEKDKTKKRKLF